MAEQDVAARLSVEVEARLGKLDAGLKQAEDRSKKSGKKIDKLLEGKDAFGGVVKGALKAVAIVGTLTVATAAANVGFKLMKGDIEGAAEAMKNLPLGLGAFARGLEEILGNITGIGDEIEKLNKMNDIGNQLLSLSQSVMENRKRVREADEAGLKALEGQVELLGKSKSEALAILQARRRQSTIDDSNIKLAGKGLKLTKSEREKIVKLKKEEFAAGELVLKTEQTLRRTQRFSNDAAIEQAEAALAAAKSEKMLIKNGIRAIRNDVADRIAIAGNLKKKLKADDLIAAEETRKLDKQISDERDAENKKRADERDREGEKREADRLASNKKFLAKRKAAREDAEREAEKKEDERLSRSDQRASIDSKIRQTQFETAGKFAAAEQEEISESFRSQIAEAERAGRGMVAARLRTLRDLKLADAMDRVRATSERGTGSQIDSREARIKRAGDTSNRMTGAQAAESIRSMRLQIDLLRIRRRERPGTKIEPAPTVEGINKDIGRLLSATSENGDTLRRIAEGLVGV